MLYPRKAKSNAGSVHQEWVITPQLPWYKNKSIISSISVIMICIVSTYAYLNYSLYNTKQQLSTLIKDYQQLNLDYLSLKSTKIRLQRELEVAKKTKVETNGNLVDLHKKTQDLSEQLELYKRVMSDTDTSDSILVENLAMLEAGQPNVFYLNWVLLQARAKRNIVQGKLSVKLAGKLGDTYEVLNYSDIAVDNNKIINYKFRDFQQFSKRVKLPDGFVLSKITVEIIDNKSKLSKSNTYDLNKIGRQLNVAQK